MITFEQSLGSTRRVTDQILLNAFGYNPYRVPHPAYAIREDGLIVGTFGLVNIKGYKGLVSFAITPEEQGRGLGTAVINLLKGQVKSLAILNEPAQHLKEGLYKGIPIIDVNGTIIT